MAKGGARPGAGRKKGHKASHTVEAEAAKARLVQMFVESKEAIYKALIRQAVVHCNVQAIKELFDRVWGKSVQPIGNDGQKAFIVQWLSQSTTNQDSGQKASTPRISVG